MNNATKQDLLPPLVADLLSNPVTYIDNIFEYAHLTLLLMRGLETRI